MKIYNTRIEWDCTHNSYEILRKYIPEYSTSLDAIYEGLCKLVSDIDVDKLFYIFGKYNINGYEFRHKKVTVYREGDYNKSPSVILNWAEATVKKISNIVKVTIDGKEYSREEEKTIVSDFYPMNVEKYLYIEKIDVSEYSGKEYSLTDSFSK